MQHGIKAKGALLLFVTLCISQFAAPGARAESRLKYQAMAPHLSQMMVSFKNIPTREQVPIQAGIDIWSQYWKSSVPVKIMVQGTAMEGEGIETLTNAAPYNFFRGFKGAPDSTIWYPTAMANALANKDLDPANPDLVINVNITRANSFYLGSDGNCPSYEYDLESLIIHEMSHGLGFFSNDTFDLNSGYGTIDEPTPFDAFAQTPNGSRLMDLQSPSVALGTALQNTLVWSGSHGISANNGVKPILETPSPYVPGISVSHLDQSTFEKSGANALMTPYWPTGVVYRSPGSLVLAMFQDMLGKTPPGTPTTIPDAPQNVSAIVGDKSAIVNFDAPDNSRTSPVTYYTVKVNQSHQTFQSPSSPIYIPKLTNGSAYSFTVTATNQLGSSPPALSNTIYPQAEWKSGILDSTADAKYLASTTFRGAPTVLYTDSKRGLLKMALWNGKTWAKSIVDGNSVSSGRTHDDVSGYVSVCTSAAGKNQRLDVVYPDLTKKQLRLASFNGQRWSYAVIDGNGSSIETTADNRGRTASDVSGPNACVDVATGIQIFYRDESEGFILGAIQNGTSLNNWHYELVDGDRDTGGRTLADVGFHIKATNVGRNIYLIYDAISQVNRSKQAIAGSVRLAKRSSIYPEDWQYQDLDRYGDNTAVAGYDVALFNDAKAVIASWMAASGQSLPLPDQLRWIDLTANGDINSTNTEIYGTPSSPLALSDSHLLFNCLNRLCSLNISDQTVSLVTTLNITDSEAAAWVTFNKNSYALIGVGGKLLFFK
jgi:Fibronectin type III domain